MERKLYDFAAMTRSEALDALADLDARLWGEENREPSRELNSRNSRGLIINAIAHHPSNDYGDALTPAESAAARKQLTRADWAELRKGG